MRREENQKLKTLDVKTKVEDDYIFNTQELSSSRQQSMFKNPRIVHVPRSFGGKDRHSKVTTVKGLKDRRIRLSVPTAIQLYDLQDRLGLSQPSKVVDWLLAASKDEINRLPPLQMPPGNLNIFHNPTLNLDSNSLKTTFYPYFNAYLSFFKDKEPQSSVSSKEGINENLNFGHEDINGKSKDWKVDSSEQNQDGSNYGPQVSVQSFFPISSQSFQNFLNNSIPDNSFYHLEPNSNLSLTQFGSHGFQNHVDGGHSNLSQSLHSSGSKLYPYPPAQTPSIIFPNPNNIGASSSENDEMHVSMFLPNPFMSSLHRHQKGD